MKPDDKQKHLAHAIGFANEHARNFPPLVLIASSSPCNLKCPGCPCTQLDIIRQTKNEEGKIENYFKYDDYVRLADQCAEYAKDSFKPKIRISGYGEPFLNKNLLKMIEYSCNKGVPTSLITNGTLLTEEKSKKIIDLGLESIEFSVDAHNTELYAIMRVGGDFEKLVQNVKKFVEIRNKYSSPRKTFIIASVVRTPDNDHLIEEITAFWKNIGVDHVSIRKFLTWGIDALEDVKKQMGGDHYLENDAPCPYPYERILIDPAGWVRLCPYDDQQKIPDFGHIAKTPIHDIWTGERFKKIRGCHGHKFDKEGSLKDAPLCHDCEDRRNRSWTFNYINIIEGKNNKPEPV